MGRTRESANLVSDKNIFVDIANDLVGIGTTAPTATLEVSGTLTVSGISTFQNNVDLGDDDKLRLGTGNDLEIYHNGSNSFISDVGTGILVISGSQVQIKNAANTENCAKFFNDGAVELYYDNAKKFETGQFGATITGSLAASNIDLEDDAKLLLGTGDDLQIYHDGTSNIFLGNGSADFKIQDANHTSAIFDTSAEVQLYYDNSKKFETTSSGITVTGTVAATAVTGDGSGLTNVPTGFSPINFVLS